MTLSHNQRQAILSIASATLYLAVGVWSLVVALMNPNPLGGALCGFDGQPPLRDWVYGTGIAYTIIGGTHLLSAFLLCSVWCLLVGIIPVFLILLLGGMFTFSWMIVGAVSLWRDGNDCRDVAFTVWVAGMFGVISSIVLVIAGCFSTSLTKSSTDERKELKKGEPTNEALLYAY
jgi:hypothetical protein